MTAAERYADWVERYIAAWNSNEPEEISDLFTDETEYLPVPYAEGWHGRDEIVREWLDRKDEPGDFRFTYEIIAATDDVGILTGQTLYLTSGEEYYNLWEMTLDAAGRCSRFVEWWMQPPK